MKISTQLLSLCLMLNFLMPVEPLSASGERYMDRKVRKHNKKMKSSDLTFLGELARIPCCWPPLMAYTILYGTAQVASCIIEKAPSCAASTSRNCVKCSTKCYQKRCASRTAEPTITVTIPQVIERCATERTYETVTTSHVQS